MTRRNAGKTNGAVPDLSGLSRGATYRFDPHLARELQIYQMVLGLSQKDMVEQGLELFFEKHGLTKKERDAAETLLNAQVKRRG